MSEFIREHGEIVIAVLVFVILLSVSLKVAPQLKNAMEETVETIVDSSESD